MFSLSMYYRMADKSKRLKEFLISLASLTLAVSQVNGLLRKCGKQCCGEHLSTFIHTLFLNQISNESTLAQTGGL